MDWKKLTDRAASAPSYDIEEYEQLRQVWASKVHISVEPDEYDCPVCGNLGARLFHREGIMGMLAVPCSCQSIRANWQHIRQSGMEGLLQRCSFEKFEATSQWQQAILQGAKAYAADPRGWILLAGQSGSGKTHLCSAICRSLAMQKKTFVYMPWREEIMALKGQATDYVARQPRMNRFMKAPYLFIDDLFKSPREQGKVTATRADIEHAFELLNYRYNQNLPTILSTELLPEELEALDEALHSRILERCGKHFYTIKRSPDRNYRKQQGRDPVSG